MTYTRDEIMAMSVEQLRIEIAKRNGWIDIFVENGRHIGSHSVFGRLKPIPNYPNDIAAAYELEESVPILERDEYVSILWHVIFFRTDNDLSKPGFYVIHATAEQRSRAWLIWSEQA